MTRVDSPHEPPLTGDIEYTITFTYNAYGQIKIMASTMEEAELLAKADLETICEAGSIHQSKRIVWLEDEIEV